MKRLFFLMVALMLTLSASAQTYSYLTVKMNSGTEQSLKLDGLKLTFDGQDLKAVNSEESASFTLADLAKMYFSVNATGIDAVTTTATASGFKAGRLIVNAPAGTTVSVYNVAGQLVGKYQKSVNGTEQLGSNFGHGVYIVRAGSNTSKLLAE